MRASLITDERKNRTTYGLFTFSRDYPGIGQVQLFDMLKKARDTIQDDLVQWVQIPGDPGTLREMVDPLFAQDTWIHTLWLGFERKANFGLHVVTRLKYETIRQQEDESRIPSGGPRFKKNTRFWGLIGKVDHMYKLGKVIIQPKVKSEWLKDNTPYSIRGEERLERNQWTGLFFLVSRFPVLWKTTIEMGFEQMIFQELSMDEAALNKGDFTGDFRSAVTVVQVSNAGAYVGYKLTTNLGIKMVRSSRERADEGRKSQLENFVYLTMYAGLKE